MNVTGRVRASFDTLLYRGEHGEWVNFISGDTRECKVQLLQNEAGYVLNCKQDGQVGLTFNTLMDINFINEQYMCITRRFINAMLPLLWR